MELYLENQETQRKLQDEFDKMVKVMNDLTGAMTAILEMSLEDEVQLMRPGDMPPEGCGARQYT